MTPLSQNMEFHCDPSEYSSKVYVRKNLTVHLFDLYLIALIQPTTKNLSSPYIQICLLLLTHCWCEKEQKASMI